SSAGSGAGSAGAPDAASAGEQAAPGAAGAAAATAATEPGTGGAVDPAAQQRAVVSTADLTVRVDDLAAASAAVQRLTVEAGGLVTASRTGSAAAPPAGPPEEGDGGSADGSVDGSTARGGGDAHLTLRVPAARSAEVLDAVAALGTQLERSTASADVTAEVADVGSRVVSAQAVLATFRERLPQATTIPDVLALEGEIARRQADLEALQARQRVLADQVALATVEVSLTAGALPARSAAAPGFRGGLAAGWRALGESARVVALALGAVLPFALPAALVAAPLLVVRRRRRTTGSSAAGGA
ncbi:DUF4349 domain-containing protein, partial [Kineococcus sp. T13]|uniref:DUF4349 domain-containing protein n=1 Tax=Kineococcus vitellinus TaxID=2696565 RepID=UPI0014136F11